MSKTVTCDRCGATNPMTNLVLDQYKMVRIGGNEWDVCGPCKDAVRKFLLGADTLTAVAELRAVKGILEDAKVPLVGDGRVSGGVAALVLDRDRLAEKVDGLEAAVTAHQGGDASE